MKSVVLLQLAAEELSKGSGRGGAGSRSQRVSIFIKGVRVDALAKEEDEIDSCAAEGQQHDANQWPVEHPSNCNGQQRDRNANDNGENNGSNRDDAAKKPANERDPAEGCNDRRKQEVESETRKEHTERADDLGSSRDHVLLLVEPLIRGLFDIDGTVNNLLKHGREALVDAPANVAAGKAGSARVVSIGALAVGDALLVRVPLAERSLTFIVLNLLADNSRCSAGVILEYYSVLANVSLLNEVVLC